MKGDELSERLIRFAVQAIRAASSLPNSRMGRHIADQLGRSGTSPGANYEEARRSESAADFVHKIRVAAKEVGEAGYWLRVAVGAALLSAEYEQLAGEARELAAILGASARTARASK